MFFSKDEAYLSGAPYGAPLYAKAKGLSAKH
jgi:hypothetical protein